MRRPLVTCLRDSTICIWSRIRSNSPLVPQRAQTTYGLAMPSIGQRRPWRASQARRSAAVSWTNPHRGQVLNTVAVIRLRLVLDYLRILDAGVRYGLRMLD